MVCGILKISSCVVFQATSNFAKNKPNNQTMKNTIKKYLFRMFKKVVIIEKLILLLFQFI